MNTETSQEPTSQDYELVDTITQLVLYVAVLVVGGLLGYEHGRQQSQADAFMRGVDTLLQLCPAIF